MAGGTATAGTAPFRVVFFCCFFVCVHVCVLQFISYMALPRSYQIEIESITLNFTGGQMVAMHGRSDIIGV